MFPTIGNIHLQAHLGGIVKQESKTKSYFWRKCFWWCIFICLGSGKGCSSTVLKAIKLVQAFLLHKQQIETTFLQIGILFFFFFFYSYGRHPFKYLAFTWAVTRTIYFKFYINSASLNHWTFICSADNWMEQRYRYSQDKQILPLKEDTDFLQLIQVLWITNKDINLV